VVFIGTIWPLLAEMVWGRVLSVGPPFFNAAFTPFFVGLAVILPVGAMLPWKRAEIGRGLRQVRLIAMLAFAVGALVFAVQTGRSALGPIGAALGVWVVVGALADLWLRTGRGAVAGRLVRLGRLPRADWGKATAHAGLGVTVFAVAAITAWVTEDIRVVPVGGAYDLGPYRVTLAGVEETRVDNYQTTRATMVVTRAGREVAVLYPEKRFYPVAEMPTTEAAIDLGVMRDLYLVIGDRQDDGSWAVRSYIKPFANWIWGGALLMALGGTLSLSDRRYRIAAGARKPALQPAE